MSRRTGRTVVGPVLSTLGSRYRLCVEFLLQFAYLFWEIGPVAVECCLLERD